MIRVGDKVTIVIPREDRCGSRELLAFNNKTFAVSMIKPVKCNGNLIYELEGVKSKAGIPFSFVKEWLQEAE